MSDCEKREGTSCRDDDDSVCDHFKKFVDDIFVRNDLDVSRRRRLIEGHCDSPGRMHQKRYAERVENRIVWR